MLTPARQLTLLLLLPASAGLLAAADPPLRLAISDRIIRGVNMNDARAAMTLWGQEIVHSAGFEVVRDQDWVLPSATLLASLRAGKMDLVCITVEEFLQVRDTVESADVITDERGGQELLVVVRRDAKLNSMADLRGRSLIVLDTASTILADAWLGTELHRAGLPVCRFSVKWRGGVPPLASVPPLWGGDFQGMRVYRSDAIWGRAREANLRARHRLNEPAKLSLGWGCVPAEPASVSPGKFDYNAPDHAAFCRRFCRS